VVDWDGTIADVVAAWLQWWNRDHPAMPLRRSAFRTYNVHRCLPPAAAQDFDQAITDPALYAESPPVPGALAVLPAWVRAGVPFVLLTGTTDAAILAVKRAWLAERVPVVAATVPVIAVPPGHKADHGGVALIDDNLAEWAAWRARYPAGPIATLPWPHTVSAPPDVLRVPWPLLAPWGPAQVARPTVPDPGCTPEAPAHGARAK